MIELFNVHGQLFTCVNSNGGVLKLVRLFGSRTGFLVVGEERGSKQREPHKLGLLLPMLPFQKSALCFFHSFRCVPTRCRRGVKASETTGSYFLLPSLLPFSSFHFLILIIESNQFSEQLSWRILLDVNTEERSNPIGGPNRIIWIEIIVRLSFAA